MKVGGGTDIFQKGQVSRHVSPFASNSTVGLLLHLCLRLPQTPSADGVWICSRIVTATVFFLQLSVLSSSFWIYVFVPLITPTGWISFIHLLLETSLFPGVCLSTRRIKRCEMVLLLSFNQRSFLLLSKYLMENKLGHFLNSTPTRFMKAQICAAGFFF